ncbi:cell division protein FtsZ [Candidatus Dojkabacteria bacterium]|nr:cell division protein FtsZ [Candidatus Dojkabacteria bacterium]
MLVKPQSTSPARIKVVGVGGGGGNAVNNMINNYDIQDVEFITINTDAQALQSSQAEIKLKIGEEVTRGLGAGGNPAIGRKAAEESVDLIHENLAGADMVFITAGMGGGTGTGACPIVASITKNLGALTVGIVTKPFTFEGKRRMDAALRGIDELKDKVDTLIVIPNQKLLEVIERNISFLEAMKRVDDVLAQAVISISDLVNQAGMINVDFADVRSVMTNAGTALMGIGKSAGEERAREAANMAITSPLLELSIEGAKGVLFNIKGGNDLAMYEVDEAAKIIQDAVDPSANIIFGASIDPEMKDGIEITVLATGFDLTTIVDTPRLNTFSTNNNLGGSTQFTDVNISPQSKIDTKLKTTSPVETSNYKLDKEPMADLNGDDDLDSPSFMRRRKQF